MYQVIKVQTTMIWNQHLLSAQFCQELCCCQKRQVAKLCKVSSVFTPQSIIHQDVRVKEYAFHRLNRALRRGSLSISSSVNDAQPLHFRISDDTGIVLYGFFVLATTFVFLAGVSVFTKVSTFFSIPSSSAMMLSSRSSSAFNCSVVIILTGLILGCKDKQLIRINNILLNKNIRRL